MDNKQNILRATSILIEYLYALGGSAIPMGRGMESSEIVLYVVTKLYELNDETFKVSDYIRYDFTDIAAYALPKANKHIEMVILSDEELIPFLREFYNFHDSKFKGYDKSPKWIEFGEFLNKNADNQQNGKLLKL